MAEHPNVARVRRALEARADGDADGLGKLLDDDVVWHRGDGDVRGKDAVIREWSGSTGGAASPAAVRDVYSDGGHGLGIVEWSNGVRQMTIAHLRGDKAVEIWGLPTDAAIATAAEAGEPVPEHPNVAIVHDAEAARQRSTFDDADMATMKGFLADNVIWHMGGESEFAKAPPPASADEVIGKFKFFKQATGGTFFFDIHEVFADDTHAVSLVTITADNPRHPERHMNADEANVMHLDSDGRAYEFWGVAADEAERDAFWAP